MVWSASHGLQIAFSELAQEMKNATAAAADAISIDLSDISVNPNITQFKLHCEVILPSLMIFIEVDCGISVLIPLVWTIIFQR